MAFSILFLGGLAGGYFYFIKNVFMQQAAQKTGSRIEEDMTALRIFYPIEGRLQMEDRTTERKISQIAIAQAALEEFLKGPAGATDSYVPKDVKALGLFFGTDGILYVDLSDEFRSNFIGDAINEFMLLRGLYESLMYNVEGLRDVKLLIEGSEIDTIGGHLSLLHPLGMSIPNTTAVSNAAADTKKEDKIDTSQ